MAKSKTPFNTGGDKKRSKIIQNIVNNVGYGMDSLYKNTYMTTPINNRDLNNVKDDFNKSLDRLMTSNYDNNGDSNLSKLFTSTLDKRDDNLTSLIDIFEDKTFTQNIINDFSENKKLKDFDDEVDQILMYMPMLEDALDAKKDNVLSADNFSRDYLNIVTDQDSIEVNESFNKNIKQLKERYDLLELSEYCYDMASKYGEQFIYIDSYKDALFKLIKNKPSLNNPEMTNETYGREYKSENIICESLNINEFMRVNHLEPIDTINENSNLFIEMNTCGSIESVIMERENAERIKTKTKKTTMAKKLVPDALEFEGLGQEGLVDTKEKQSKTNNLKINGSIIKKLPRENIIISHIDEMVLGYYYIECESELFLQGEQVMLYGTNKAMRVEQNRIQEEKRNKLLRSLSANISKYIDNNFINSHQDLKEEIYIILKHNEMFAPGSDINKIKVTFIPPENMVHYCFEKDPKTLRGISDLSRALLPAKIWVYLYLNDTIGNLTRSQDKRMYNVKNNVDTNISQVLLNTISQLRKSNMGARELTSMKTMLNITGRFNDVIIPVGPSGESPIDFQVMEGQNIETKTDLMEMMQEMAVNATDVPYDYVQSRKMTDYAVRLTMSSSKFLRKSFKRQAIVQKLLSRIVTILYNNEFNNQDNQVPIKLYVMLPPPNFLQMLNNNQLFSTVNEQVELILSMQVSENADPDLRQRFRMKLVEHYMKGYVDIEMIKNMYKTTEMEYSAERESEGNEE